MKNSSKWLEWIYCWCGVLGFSLVFVFNKENLHYYIYMIPFGAILVSVCMVYPLSLWKKVCNSILLFITMIVSFYYVYDKRVCDVYLTGCMQATEKYYATIANKIESYYSLTYQTDDNPIVWFTHSGIFSVYYFGDFIPPNIREYGYSFGPLALSEKDVLKHIECSDIVVASPCDKTKFQYLTDSVFNSLSMYKSYDLGNGVTLYDMHILVHNNSLNKQE